MNRDIPAVLPCYRYFPTMPKKRPRPEQPDKLREDAAETAFRVLQEAIGERPKTPPPGQRTEAEKDPEAVKRGKKGGDKGGKARAESLTPEQRSAIAKKAADNRWHDRD